MGDLNYGWLLNYWWLLNYGWILNYGRLLNYVWLLNYGGTLELWVTFELWGTLELWVIFELWVTFQLWVRGDKQTNKQTDRQTNKHTLQYHDSAWPKGRAKWKHVFSIKIWLFVWQPTVTAVMRIICMTTDSDGCHVDIFENNIISHSQKWFPRIQNLI